MPRLRRRVRYGRSQRWRLPLQPRLCGDSSPRLQLPPPPQPRGGAAHGQQQPETKGAVHGTTLLRRLRLPRSVAQLQRQPPPLLLRGLPGLWPSSPSASPPARASGSTSAGRPRTQLLLGLSLSGEAACGQAPRPSRLSPASCHPASCRPRLLQRRGRRRRRRHMLPLHPLRRSLLLPPHRWAQPPAAGTASCSRARCQRISTASCTAQPQQQLQPPRGSSSSSGHTLPLPPPQSPRRSRPLQLLPAVRAARQQRRTTTGPPLRLTPCHRLPLVALLLHGPLCQESSGPAHCRCSQTPPSLLPREGAAPALRVQRAAGP